MTRSELMKSVRARGTKVAPHHIEYLAQAGRLDPEPRLDGSHRRVFEEAHVDQVLGHLKRKVG